MRILFIAPLPEPITGQSLASQVLLDELRSDHAIDVVDLSKEGFAQGADSYRRVREILGVLWRVWRLRSRADAIYLTIAESRAGNARDLLIYVLCLGKLDRMLVHLHGGAGIRELLADRASLTTRANAFFLRRLAGIIVLGERHLSMFLGIAGRGRLHVVPNFAQEEMFLEEAEVARKFERTHPLRLLFLSNLLPGKGHLELVQAFGLLSHEERRGLRVDFAGDFEREEDRASFLASIAPYPQFAYHGVVRGAAKVDLFSRAHVFCLPTYYPYEGQPISILEGYAAGCAVITTDHSGIFDIFVDGVNGVAVEKKSAASLAGAIRRVLGDIEAARVMAVNNHRTARARYRMAQFTATLRRLIEDCGQPV